MVTAVFRGSNNHYNPDEPRDSRGCWTNGGTSSTDWALCDPSEIGRARTLLGHGRFGLYPKFTQPTDDEARDFARLLRAWNAASGLDDQRFHDLFVGDKLASLATTRLMREAARKAAAANTIDQMIEASRPLTAAIKAIGPSRWPHVLRGIELCAEQAEQIRGSKGIIQLTMAPQDPFGIMPGGFWSRPNDMGGGGSVGRQPKLQRIHPDATYESGEARYALEDVRKMSTEDIVRSLAPSSREPLTVKPDGRIVDGNTRIKVLQERGYDIETLPRVTMP